VLQPVAEDVRQRIPHLARRPEQPRVVTVAPYTAVTPERSVDRLRGSDREALDPGSEARRRMRFHQQMQMIGLNAELEHAEAVM